MVCLTLQESRITLVAKGSLSHSVETPLVGPPNRGKDGGVGAAHISPEALLDKQTTHGIFIICI